MDLYRTVGTIHAIVVEIGLLSSEGYRDQWSSNALIGRIDQLYDALSLESQEMDLLMWSMENQFICVTEKDTENANYIHFLVGNLLRVLTFFGTQPSAIPKTCVRCRFICSFTSHFIEEDLQLLLHCNNNNNNKNVQAPQSLSYVMGSSLQSTST